MKQKLRKYLSNKRSLKVKWSLGHHGSRSRPKFKNKNSPSYFYFSSEIYNSFVKMFILFWRSIIFSNFQSEKVSRSGYNGKWYETTLEMQKCLLNVLVYQEPVIFSINCVVPEFSLPYYCSVSQSVYIDCRLLNPQMALLGYRSNNLY